MVHIRVFYNDTKGYIVTSYGIAKGIGYLSPLYPAIGLEQHASEADVAKAIEDALKISKSKGEVDPKENNDKYFWDISGIKSFDAFSKKYSSVGVSISENKISVHKSIRAGQGAYVASKDPADNLELDVLSDVDDITRAVLNLLKKKNDNSQGTKKQFETLGYAKVEYSLESERLDDCGDGGTDAYQIFREPDTRNYIAFLIDNGYSSFANEDVRTVLERQYGKFEEYLYDAGTGRICVKAHNDKCRIETNIFYTKDDSIEVMYYTEGESKLIAENYSKIISSIKIQWAEE